MTDNLAFLHQLQDIIASRRTAATESSYTAALLAAGPRRIAQKVGEEGVELALAGVGDDRGAIIAEAADLVYHMLVLLTVHDVGLRDVVTELERRHAR